MTISIDDRQLVESYQAGDSEAFSELVRAHGPSLLGHAIRNLHDRAAAEDAVQETFVRAYRALPRFDGDYRLGPWLHRILANVCADEGNRRRREAEKFDRFAADPFASDAAAPGVEDELGLELDDTDLAAAIASLPPAYREALSLRFVQDLPYDEVAKVAGVSEQNARARVSRARSAARAALRGVAALPVLCIPALRRSERMAAAADQAEAARAGATVGQAAGSSAPALAPATDAVMASAPAAAPLLTKAVVGLAAVAAMAAPSMAPETGAGRAVGQATTPVVAEANTTTESTPEPAAVETQSAPAEGSAPVADPADPSEGAEEVARGGAGDVAPGDDAADAVTLPAPGPDASAPVAEGDDPPVEEAPAVPAPEVRAPGELTIHSLVLEPAGPRYTVSGQATLTIDGESFTGPVAGRLLFTDDEAAGVRRITAELFLAASGDVPVDIRLEAQGRPIADQAEVDFDEVTAWDLVGRFGASSDDPVLLLDSGVVTGLLDLAAGTFGLSLAE